MATTYVGRKPYDIHRWERLNRDFPNGAGGGAVVVAARSVKNPVFFLRDWLEIYVYDVEADGFLRLPASGTATQTGSGTSGCTGAWSTGSTTGVSSLTATAGTTSTITTNQTIVRSLAGWKIHIMAGPNAGATLDIVSNTFGSNSVITVATQAAAFSNATQFRLLTPVVWHWIANSLGREFRKYDWATNTWSAALANPPSITTFGTDAALASTPSWIDTNYVSFATGTATSATATTLVNSSKSWTSGQWVNYQIRITGGTGAGQIRTITASDATSVTVSIWTITPDSTSTYSIEGNDDFLYLIGNNTTLLYKYQISTNTWTQLAPSPIARAGNPAAGASLLWISQSENSTWTNENSIINGRRLYSFRGGGTVMDYYDIAANNWVNNVVRATQSTSITSGAKYVVWKDDIYYSPASANNFVHRYNVVEEANYPFSSAPAPGTLSSSGTGNASFLSTFRDGNTIVPFFYGSWGLGLFRVRLD